MPRPLARAWFAAALALAQLPAGRAWSIEPPAPVAAEASAAYDGTWTALPAPGPRIGSSLVYDSQRDRLLMFDGTSAVTWELDPAADSSWRRVATTGRPTSGLWHASIYDPVRDRLIVFGGSRQDALWELPLSGTPAWAPLVAQGTGPVPLSMASAIYDPVRDRMVIFAGMDTLSQPRGELWELALSGTPTWSPLNPAGSGNLGLPRHAHAATYDSRRDRMLVFGGIQNGLRLSSVWACDFTGGDGWHVLAAGGTGPTARLGAAAAYDSLADALVVHGGYDGGFPNDAKLLSFAGAPTWSDLAPAPRGRYWAASAFDPVRERLVVFGGKDSLTLGDTWALGLGANPGWHALGALAPAPRMMASAVIDVERQRLLLFGGSSENAATPMPFFNDVWALSLTNPPRWTPLAPMGSPPLPRYGHSAIYDPLRQRVLVFGGTDVGQQFSDLWELSLQGTPTWTQLAVGDSVPEARRSHVAVYDPVRDRMVIAGGVGSSWELLNDAWALSLSTPVPQWTRIPTAWRPPYGLAESGVAYDPVRDQMLAFGGRSPFGGATEACYALRLGGTPEWAFVGSGTPPWPRLGPVAAYDPEHERLVVYGGCSSRSFYTGYWFADTWELPLTPDGEWRALAPGGDLPGARSDAAYAFDAARGRLLVVGGESFSIAVGDAFSLALSQTLAVPPAAAGRLAFAAPWPNPARGATRFEFVLPARADLTLDLYDVSGRRVVRLAGAAFAAGRHTLAWDGRDASGRETGAGIYFAHLRAGGAHATVRCVRLGGRP